VGCQQAPVYIEPLVGTVIMATGGRDKEDAPALFEMGDSSTVAGLTVFYAEQKPDDVHPYAWTLHLTGGDNTAENVTLINSFNGIRIGPEPNVRHRIRSAPGCVLRRGISLELDASEEFTAVCDPDQIERVTRMSRKPGCCWR